MVEKLGAEIRRSTEEVSFDYTVDGKTHTIYAMLNLCHALKLVRKIFADNNLVDGQGETISFKHLRALHELQKKKSNCT